jgi:hypothetical protein
MRKAGAARIPPQIHVGANEHWRQHLAWECLQKLRGSYQDQMSRPPNYSQNETQAKALLKEIVMELVQERRDWFFEIVVEALEEIGLANAIREGRQNEFVSEAEIAAILEERA